MCTYAKTGWYLDANSNACLTECPYGYYEDSDTRTCKACYEEGCIDCSSATKCTECDPTVPYYLLSGDCYEICPSGTFADDKDCTYCSDPCEECYGPDSDNCDVCKTKYFYRNTCIDPCLDGEWANTDTKTCDNCHETCQTCSAGGETDCKTCDPADDLWKRKDLGTCVDDCGI